MCAAFSDQRDDDLNAAAPDDAMGVFSTFTVMVKIFSGRGLGQPGSAQRCRFADTGRKFAWFNDYYPVQAIAYGVTDGATDDFAYGDLGVCGLHL